MKTAALLLAGLSLTNAGASEAHLTQRTDIPLVTAQGHEIGGTMTLVPGVTVDVLNLDPNTGIATVVYGSATVTIPIDHLDAAAAAAPHTAVTISNAPAKTSFNSTDEEQAQSLIQPGKTITFYRNPGPAETKESHPIDKATAQGNHFHLEFGGKTADGRFEKRMILKVMEGGKLTSIALYSIPEGWQSWNTGNRTKPFEVSITGSAPVVANTPKPSPLAASKPATPPPTVNTAPTGKVVSASELRKLLETPETKINLLPGPVAVTKDPPPRRIFITHNKGEATGQTVLAYWKLNPKAAYRVVIGGDIKEIWGGGNSLAFNTTGDGAVCDLPSELYSDGNITLAVVHRSENLGSMRFESTDPTPILPLTYVSTGDKVKTTEPVSTGFENSFTWNRTVIAPGQFVYLNVPSPETERGNLKDAILSLLTFHDPSYTEAAGDLFTVTSTWGRDEMWQMARHFRDIGYMVEDTTTSNKTQADKQRLVEVIKTKLEGKNPVLVYLGNQWKLVVGYNNEDSTFFVETPAPAENKAKAEGLPPNIQKLPMISLTSLAQEVELASYVPITSTKETVEGLSKLAPGMPHYLTTWINSDGKIKGRELHSTLKRLQVLAASGSMILVPSGSHVLVIPKQQAPGDAIQAKIVPEGIALTTSLKDVADLVDSHQGIFFSPREID